MFLVAVTNSEIANKLQSFDVEEFKINSAKITIVTDNFLSKIVSEPNGFSVIESPLISYHNFEDIVFSQVRYNKESNVLEIFKSSISGRPIYYHINSEGNLFCSTHISMLRKGGVKIEENIDVLPQFFVYRFIMPPQTMYENIKQLLTGSRLYIKIANGKCKIKSIHEFDPPRQDKRISSLNNISKTISNYLSNSIRALNPRKGRLAVLLSGGLDSSILFKMCQTLNYEIDVTYSTGYPFENPRNFEKEYALSASDSFQIKHRYHEPTIEEYLRGFIEAISIAEEPLLHMQSVLLYLLFKDGLPQNKDIVINGQGADCLFLGYGINLVIYRYRILLRLLNRYKSFFFPILRVASHFPGLGRARSCTKIICAIQDPNHIIWSSAPVGDEDWVCKYFKTKRYDIIKDPYNTIKSFEDRPIYDIVSIYDLLGDTSITQSTWAKLGESQRKIVYYPYNQCNLQNFTYSIPWDVKLKSPKYVLREVAHHYNIPEFIVTRPKRGFHPETERPLLKGGIFDSLIPLASKVFDEKQIQKMQPSAWDWTKFWTFWNILNYSIWKRLLINNEPLNVLLEELD